MFHHQIELLLPHDLYDIPVSAYSLSCQSCCRMHRLSRRQSACSQSRLSLAYAASKSTGGGADGASGALLALTCWTGGLATLAEKKSRRMELAHYCLARAIESFALCLTSWGYVRGDCLPKRIDIIIFSAATAAIMHCYSDSHGKHRDVFKSKYLNVLDFIFGNTGEVVDAS